MPFNNLKIVQASTFNQLRSLYSLNLMGNEIHTVEFNTFNNFTNLQILDLASNQLNQIDARSFGSALANLTFFFADHNNISYIDPDFFDSALNLDLLFLIDNICVSSNFVNVQQNRQSVRQQLQTCINNFQPPLNFIRCNFEFYEGFYLCDISLYNPLGLANFTTIEGEHLPGMTNANVTAVASNFGESKTIPSIICR
jgi:hypothetical protein